EVWNAIDVEIGESATGELTARLIEFRSAYQEHLVATVMAEVTKLLEVSKGEAWKKWAAFVAASVSRFRFWLTERLCAPAIHFEGAAEDLAQKVRAMAPVFSRGRWPEVRSVVESLTAIEFLEPRVKGELLTIVAEIDVY